MKTVLAALAALTLMLSAPLGFAETFPIGAGGNSPPAVDFAGLSSVTCSSTVRPTRVVTDSNTNTPGAQITGTGAHVVTADCDGTAWRVRGSTGGGSADSCAGYSPCATLTDEGDSGKFAEDFNRAYRELAFDEGVPRVGGVVYLGAPSEQPASGYILLEDRVRWCATTTEPEEGDPLSCDATDACTLPTLKLVGDWSKFIISTDWTDENYPNVWTPNADGPDAALWFGDQFEDGGVCMTPVDIPPLRVEEVYVDPIAYVSVRPWNGILPILGDGITGDIGYASHDTVESGFQALGPLFVGSNLNVHADVSNGGYYGSGVQAMGDNVRILGNVHGTHVSFGQDVEGLPYLPSSSVRTWGGVPFQGTYTFDVQGDDLSVVFFNASDATLPRTAIGPSLAAKPVVSFFTGGNNAYPRVNFLSSVVTDSTTQSAVRVTAAAQGDVGDPDYPPVLNFFGGLYPNTVNADAGAIVQCGQALTAGANTTGYGPTLPPARGCQYNLFGAKRAPGGKLQIPGLTTGVTRFQPASPAGEVYQPDERRFETIVSYDAGSANGLCILNPTSGEGASIGTCDASAIVRVSKPTLISRREIELLSDAPADSQYRLVMQIEVAPGSNTWLDGRVGPQDCTAANDPHPACTGTAAAVGISRGVASGWLHPHYGEAAHPIHGMSSDDAGEVYHAATLVYLAPGQGYRWIFKPILYCDAASGGREDWECTQNTDCDPSTFNGDCDPGPGSTTGGVNALKVRWVEVPTERDPQCYDGQDNDGDSLVDWASSGGDPQCSNRLDDSE